MASSLFYNNTHFVPFIILFLVFNLFIIPSTNSLTTVSISENTNQTLICALTGTANSQNPGRHSLNCTTFHGGAVRTPINLDIPLSETVSGDRFLCGLALRDFQSPPSTSVLFCSRFSAINGPDQTYQRVYRGPALRELDSGNSHICAIVNATNRLECWQWKEFRNSSTLWSSAGNFTKISVGEDFVCGISSTAAGGNITCVGSNRRVVRREPLGGYLEIASGVSHACAISAVDGGLKCWGDIENYTNPEERFLSLASGENRSCGLRYNKTVVCWGQNGFVLPESLREVEFISIEGKRRVFCGVLLLNSSLFCWGGSSNNASMVFEAVLPGPCRAQSECRCGPMQGQGKYCGSGLAVCRTCPVENPTPPVNPPESLPPAPPPPPPPRRRGWSRKMVAFMVVGCVGCSCFVMICGFFLFRYCKGRVCRVHDSGRLDEIGSGSDRRQTRPSGRVLEKRLSRLISAGATGTPLEKFSLQALMDATENFSERRKIGAGSFGSVYRGKLPDGREVAVKRAESSPSSSSHLGGTPATRRQEADENKDRAFARELEFLSRLNHRNLVRLLGFHEDSKERVLVYEYLSNGTLHDHLHRAAAEDSPLRSWPERIRVAAEAARGIQYLHDFAVPSIIHRDIKSANILLDEAWTAKVSDFGLSLMGPEDEGAHLSAKAAGTVGYIDPEYFRRQKLTSKSDVYSFGVVLLELLSGQRAIHKNENGVPRNVVDYVVPYVVQDEIHRALDRRVAPPTPYEIEAVAYVGYLAADCVTLEGRDRPTMAEIVSSLERALAACLARPHLSRSTTESST